jgi:ribokinase
MPNNKTDLVICGSIGLDDIKTPLGEVTSVPGGSAIYAAIAASHFARPGIVSVVGKDFPQEELANLKGRGIDLEGLTVSGKTFRWGGLYEFDMSEAKTILTELNSMSGYEPKVPISYRDTKFLLLANIDPAVQIIAASACSKAFVVLDTMNYWIKNQKEKLIKAVKMADLVVLNEAEARQFSGEINLIKAAKMILRFGPEYVVIKKGEHGALLFSDGKYFSAPGFPLDEVKDPTGAGDSFAGTLIGYLASTGETSEKNLRKGIIYASTVASYCTEDFSTKKLCELNKKIIEERYAIFQEIRKF